MMSDPVAMTEEQIAEAMLRIPLWERQGDTISRLVVLRYHAGVALAVHVADLSRLTHHHADINISFDGTRFTLTTHDAGSVLTEADFQLAERIDVVAAGHAAAWDLGPV
jgi:4a-hydroxytetrahydrobiopterin dehydratase